MLQRSHSRDHVAMALHAQGAGRYDQMVAEARLGAQESLRLGSTYQALQLAETGLAEAEDDLELRGMATKAAWLAGLLDDAAMHGDLWLRHSRAAGDVSEEAAALSLRLRIAYDAGDLDEMDTFTQLLIDTIDQLPGDEERAQAMAFVAQSYMLRDQILQTCDWADKAYALATANGYESVGVAAMVEKGSVLVIEAATADEGAALLRAAVDEAERIGDHLLARSRPDQPRLASPPIERDRRGTGPAAADAPPRRSSRFRLARQPYPGRGDGVAGCRRRRSRHGHRCARRGCP